MSKLLKYNTNSSSSPSTKPLFISVRVVDIILNIDHPKASLHGGVDSIGTIFP